MPTPTYTFDIAQLLRDAFGVVGVRSFDRPPSNIPYYVTGYNDIPPVEVNNGNATSMLGTPIIMPVYFDPFNYTIRENGVKKTIEQKEAFTFPAATMIDFNQATIIEKTQIQGRKGTVKEYIGLDDWMIRIRGVIVNEDKPEEYPQDVVKKLMQFRKCPTAIPIVNDLCSYLGITNIVIEHLELPALEGYPGTQPFVLDCCSDEIFELKYKNGL